MADPDRHDSWLSSPTVLRQKLPEVWGLWGAQSIYHCYVFLLGSARSATKRDRFKRKRKKEKK